MLTPTLHIKNASLAYHEKIIFSHLDLTLPPAEWTALLGKSGVGKSSLLRILAGLSSQHEIVSGHFSADNGVPIATQIAYMAQNDLLLPWLTVIENATLSLKLRKEQHHQEKITQAVTLLEKVGLAQAMHLYPHQLSGGMRQRVALIRTLIQNKPIILMDEPFSAVDTITRYKLQTLAAELLQEKTVLFVTHDPQEALRLANKIYLMHGSPASLKCIVNLTSTIPRSLTSHEIVFNQNILYQALSDAIGEIT